MAITISGNLPKIKNFYGTLKFLVTQDHMGLEISKLLVQFSFRSEPNLMINKAVIRENKVEAVTREYKVINILAVSQSRTFSGTLKF